MRNIWRLLAVTLVAGPSISYFKFERPVQTEGEGQRYLVVDETIWKHARSNLADLRLYSGQTEVPYALTTQSGSLESDRKDVRLLNQGLVGGKTEFVIDMTGVVEYDHVDLQLSTRDFVAHATVQGQDNLRGNRWAALGDSILYDLSKERLGSNTMLRLPKSTFRYLRVTIDGSVKPKEVTGAFAEHWHEQKPVWRDAGRWMSQQQEGRDTVLTFDVPDNVPAERVVFSVDPTQPNFRRGVELQNEKKMELGSGEINRIHLVRAGQKIDSEILEVPFSAVGQESIHVIVHNGDDPPLKLLSARLQQHERRIYFQAPPSGQLTLYYADEKLESPVYDYAKLFQAERNIAPAQLGAETVNPGHAGRPDERPWSEKHPAVLWVAIVAAVVILGAIALRSMKTAAAAQ